MLETKNCSHLKRSCNINEFVANALTAYVKGKKRRTIDDAFAAREDDDFYRREAVSIVEGFLGSDLKAVRISKARLVNRIGAVAPVRMLEIGDAEQIARDL